MGIIGNLKTLFPERGNPTIKRKAQKRCSKNINVSGYVPVHVEYESLLHGVSILQEL